MESTVYSPEFETEAQNSFIESNVSKESPSSSSNSSWSENREHRRDHGKNREQSREEWNRDVSFHGKNRDRSREERNRDVSFHGKNRDNFREEKRVKDEKPQQQTQQPSFSNYNYNTSENSFSDNNRRALQMMSTYNMFAAMNTQWGVNSMDGMAMAQNAMPVNSNAGMPLTTGMDVARPPGSGMNPFTFMGMTGDNNMYGMMGMGNYCQYGMMNAQNNVVIGAVKEVVQLTKSVLYPPNPNAAPPSTRSKPLGCKTVFVGGLPEEATEEIIKEVFERCGEILAIRISKKNFCHIRFANEAFVENAIYFSGYRIKIENKDEAAYTGRLHVDYAQARDDQYDYECQQRALLREARHREHMEQEYFRPPTPPPVVHYSDHEATVLGDKLRAEDSFQQAVFVLISWLERGKCNKRNAGSFYSMIQSTNSHVNRLMKEKLKYEEELNKAKLMLKQQMQGILLQFNEIGKMFNAACLQKVWDHFTKPQRKNIELWKKQTEEIKNAHVEEVLNDRIEDEMDVSDGEDNESTIKQPKDSSFEDEKKKYEDELNKLREENDSLRCQLEAAENEMMLLKSETAQEKDLKLQLLAMRTAVQSMKKEMLNLSQKRAKEEADLKEYREYKSRCLKDDEDTEDNHSDLVRDGLNFGASVSSSSPIPLTVTESEAKIIGLTSTFLNVHPFGASIDYICSYLQQVDGTVKARDVESLMRRFPTVFKEESTGIGASLERKWTFLGFQF